MISRNIFTKMPLWRVSLILLFVMPSTHRLSHSLSTTSRFVLSSSLLNIIFVALSLSILSSHFTLSFPLTSSSLHYHLSIDVINNENRRNIGGASVRRGTSRSPSRTTSTKHLLLFPLSFVNLLEYKFRTSRLCSILDKKYVTVK